MSQPTFSRQRIAALPTTSPAPRSESAKDQKTAAPVRRAHSGLRTAALIEESARVLETIAAKFIATAADLEREGPQGAKGATRLLWKARQMRRSATRLRQSAVR